MIRRGDRRPFYAPAKYVVELRPEDIELASATAEVASSQRAVAAAAAAAASFQQPPFRHRVSPTAAANRPGGFSTFQAVKAGFIFVQHLSGFLGQLCHLKIYFLSAP